MKLEIFSSDKKLFEAIKKFINKIHREIKIQQVVSLERANLASELVIFYFGSREEIEVFKKISEYNKQLNIKDSKFFYILKRDLKADTSNLAAISRSRITIYPSLRQAEITEKLRDFIFLNKIILQNRILIKKYELLKKFYSTNFSTSAIGSYINKKEDFFETTGQFTILYFRIFDLDELYDLLDIKEVFVSLSDIQTDIIDLGSKYQGTLIHIIGNGIYLLFGYPPTSANELTHINNAYKCALDVNTSMEMLNKYDPFKIKKKINFTVTVFNDTFHLGKMGSKNNSHFSILGKKFHEIDKISHEQSIINSDFFYPIIINESFKEKLFKHKILKNKNSILEVSKKNQKGNKDKLFSLIKKNQLTKAE